MRRISSDKESISKNGSIIDSLWSSENTENKDKPNENQNSNIEEPQFDHENFHSIDVTNQHGTIVNGSPRISFHNTIQNHDEIVNNLRRSFDSSLMFETQNEVQLNKVLNRRQNFNQVKINK